MHTRPADFLLFSLLWATTAFSAMTAGLALARHARHRSRRYAQHDVDRLLEALRSVARGGKLRPLRYRADASNATIFWTALEALTLDRRGWDRVSKALERARHVRDEILALKDDSPWRRELAARRVSTIHTAVARRALRSALRRGPDPVTMLAARGLARQRDGWTLTWVLDNPEGFATRPSRAVTALLRAFGPGATPVLAKRLGDGIADFRLERAVIERLGAAAHVDSAAAIAGRLAHIDLDVRVAAARALGRIGDERQSFALVSALEDGAWEVRAQAARALGRIRATGAAAGLAHMLSDSSWWVRRHAAYALRDLGPPGWSALERVVQSSSDPYAREMAGEALESREPRALSA